MAREQDQTSSPPIYKICLQGCVGSGKTSLVWQFFYNKVYTGRIKRQGEIFRKIVRVDGGDVQLNIFESPQKGDNPKQWQSYVEECDGFLLVFSITDLDSFITLLDYRDDIIRKKGANTPIILVGNKCDLEYERKVSTADGSKMAKKWGVGYIETSAISPLNVDLLFTIITRKIAAHKAKQCNERRERSRSRPCCEIL